VTKAVRSGLFAERVRKIVRAIHRFVLIGGAIALFLPGRLNAQVFDVTNGNTSGPGSLAQAVSDANAFGLPATIQIGVPTINLQNSLEPVHDLQLNTTVGGSQIILPSSSGDPSTHYLK